MVSSSQPLDSDWKSLLNLHGRSAERLNGNTTPGVKPTKKLRNSDDIQSSSLIARMLDISQYVSI